MRHIYQAAALIAISSVTLTACGERTEQKSFPLSECRDKLLADIGKNYPDARVIYEVFEDHTNTEGPVKIHDEVARVRFTIVDPEYPKELRHSLIVSGFPDLRAAELGEETIQVQYPVEWALSRLEDKGGRSVAPNEVRSYWTKCFFAPDYGSIYNVKGLELTGGESYALIERCSASPEQLIPEAEAGNAQAQYQLGQIYEKGLVMEEKSPKLAAQWYRMAAEQGMPEAQYNLGVLYAAGIDGPPDKEQALHWLQQAEQQGIHQATEQIKKLRSPAEQQK